MALWSWMLKTEGRKTGGYAHSNTRKSDNHLRENDVLLELLTKQVLAYDEGTTDTDFPSEVGRIGVSSVHNVLVPD